MNADRSAGDRPFADRICRQCGWRGAPVKSGSYRNPDICAQCGAMIVLEGKRLSVTVTGSSADDVAQVSERLSRSIVSSRERAQLRSTPWISGLFYVSALVVIVVLLLAVGKVLALWTIPIVILGAMLLLTVVGALQLRQDDKLKERGFLKLMKDVFRQIPLLARASRTSPRDAE